MYMLHDESRIYIKRSTKLWIALDILPRLIVQRVAFLTILIERFSLQSTMVQNFVCKIPEDVNKAAYEMDEKIRYDCVALDGTFCQKASIISDGSLDLANNLEEMGWRANKVSTKSAERKTNWRIFEKIRSTSHSHYRWFVYKSWLLFQGNPS